MRKAIKMFQVKKRNKMEGDKFFWGERGWRK